MIFKTIFKSTIFAAALAAFVLGFAREAHANPRPLPFTYPYETLAEGSSELEIYGDWTPLRVPADPSGAPGARLWEPAYVLQAEFEHGITDHTELGFYTVFEANPQPGGSNSMQLDGFKWRIRHRFAEAGEWPVDVAVYFELETLHDEFSFEEKVILGKRFGKLRWMANLWVEEELNRWLDGSQSKWDFVVNPTTGFTYEVTPTFQPGVEYWARGQLTPIGDGLDHVNNQVHHFIGPTVHLNFGRLWWSGGLYANLNNADKPQIGEIYGPAWFRTVLGIDL